MSCWQGVDLGIALPSFLIAMLKDEKVAPMVLLLLVACFILLPLAVMGCCLLRSNKFTGPNNIMHETLEYYAYSKYNVKESQVRNSWWSVFHWEPGARIS